MKGHSFFKAFILTGFLGAGLLVAQDALEPAPDAASTNVVAGAEITMEIAEAEKEQSAMDVVLGYIHMGGPVLYTHILMSLLALAAIIERFVNLRKSRIVPDKLAAQAMDLWKNKKYSELSTLCAKNKSILSRVIEALIEQRGNHDVTQVKMFAEDKASRELRLEARRATIISVIATLSPLVGLFGTVVGLMRAFMTVAKVGEMGDPAVLADDIGMALVTTVSGLMLAMPAMFIYSHFRSRISLFGVLLEEEVAALVNAWFVKKG